VILIDCPPSLGLLTINALSAADEVLIPVQSEIFALKAIEQLLGIIKQIKAKANPRLRIGGMLVTMYQSRTRHSQEVLEELKAAFPQQVYQAVIKRTTKFPDSVVVTEEDYAQLPETRSILRFDPNSEYAAAYRLLAQEVLK
jgi:chromosome partitioning protein